MKYRPKYWWFVQPMATDASNAENVSIDDVIMVLEYYIW